MNNNKLILSLILSIMLIGMVSASSYTFEEDKYVDLKVSCFDADNDLCSVATLCNLSVYFPNQTALVDNQAMGNNSNYYNYTLYNSERGEYSVVVICNGPSAGYSTFNYLVTADGNDQPSAFMIIFFSLTFFILFIYLLGSMFNIIKHVSTMDMDLQDTLIAMSAYFGLMIYNYFVNLYFAEPIIINMVEVFMSVMIWTHIFIPIMAFIVTYIITLLKQMKAYT